MSMVLRLFAAIALYKVKPAFLELYVDWLFNASHVFDFKEFSILKIEHSCNYVGWELLDPSVQVPDTAIVEPTCSLDFIFGINQLALQLLEIFASAKLRICFRYCEQAFQCLFELVLSLSGLCRTFGGRCQDIRTCFGDILEDLFFVSSVTLNRLD